MRRFPRVSAALALGLLPVVSGCAAGEPEAAEVPDVIDAFEYSTTSAQARAEVLRAEDRWDNDATRAAYAHAQAAIALDPMWGYAYLLASQTAPGFEDGRAHLRRAIENSGGATPAERLLIEAAQRGFDGDADGELESIDALVALDETNARAHVVRGWAYVGRDRDAEARTEFRRAIELEPDMEVGYWALVFNLITEQPVDFAGAEAPMARLLELEGDEAGVHDLYGDLLRARGDLAEARDEYTRSFELDSTRAVALQQRGHVNTFLGDYESARADYAAARDAGVDNEPASFARYLAYTHIYAGEHRIALDSLQSIMGQLEGWGVASVQGQSIATLQEIIPLASWIGDMDAARAALARVTPIMRARAAETGTPEFAAQTDGNIAFWSGFVAAHAGEYDAALEFARQAMTAVENQRNPRRNEGAHGLMGFVALRQGDYAEAVSHFEQSSRDNHWIRYQHALALEGAGRNAEALDIFRTLAEVRFNNLGVALVKGPSAQKVAEASTT